MTTEDTRASNRKGRPNYALNYRRQVAIAAYVVTFFKLLVRKILCESSFVDKYVTTRFVTPYGSEMFAVRQRYRQGLSHTVLAELIGTVWDHQPRQPVSDLLLTLTLATYKT